MRCPCVLHGPPSLPLHPLPVPSYPISTTLACAVGAAKHCEWCEKRPTPLTSRNAVVPTRHAVLPPMSRRRCRHCQHVEVLPLPPLSRRRCRCRRRHWVVGGEGVRGGVLLPLLPAVILPSLPLPPLGGGGDGGRGGALLPLLVVVPLGGEDPSMT